MPCVIGTLGYRVFETYLDEKGLTLSRFLSRGRSSALVDPFKDFLRKPRTTGIPGKVPEFCDGEGKHHICTTVDGDLFVCSNCFCFLNKSAIPRLSPFDACSCGENACTATGEQFGGVCLTLAKVDFLLALAHFLEGMEDWKLVTTAQIKSVIRKISTKLEDLKPFYTVQVPSSSSDGPPPPIPLSPSLGSTDLLDLSQKGPTDGFGAHQEIHTGDLGQVPNQEFGQDLSGEADLSTDDVDGGLDVFLQQLGVCGDNPYEPHQNSSNEDQIFRMLDKHHKELLEALNRQNVAADLGNAYASLLQRQTEAEQKEKELQEREAVIAAKEQQRAEIDAELQKQREMVKELRDQLSSGEERFKRSCEDWKVKTSRKRARFEEERANLKIRLQAAQSEIESAQAKFDSTLEKRQSEFDAQLKEQQGLVEALEQQLSQEQEEFTGRIADKEEARASLQKANADLSQRLETAESNLKKYEGTFAQVRDLFKLE